MSARLIYLHIECYMRACACLLISAIAPLHVRALRSLPALPLRALESIAKDDSTRKFYSMLLEHAGLPPRQTLYDDCKVRTFVVTPAMALDLYC